MRTARVLAVLRKELIQIRRDPKVFAIVLIAPVLQLLLFGYAATLDIRDVGVIVVDEDRSPASRRLAEALEATLELRIVGEAASRDDAETAFRRGRARLALVVPRGLEADLRLGRTARVGLLVDGADSNTATIARGVAEEVLAGRGARVAAEAAQAAGGGAAEALRPLEGDPGRVLSVRTRVLYNPELRSSTYMVPGVVSEILLVMTTLLAALSIVRERETGTLEALLATPLHPVELLVGKLVPFVAIGLLDVCLVIAVAVGWFEVPLRGHLIELVVLSLAFVMATLGLGLLVSTAAATQRQAMVTAFTILMPSVLLSGFLFPIESMPAPFRVLAQLVPVRHHLHATRAIFLRGATGEALLPELLALLGLGGLLFFAAVLRFRDRLG